MLLNQLAKQLNIDLNKDIFFDTVKNLNTLGYIVVLFHLYQDQDITDPDLIKMFFQLAEPNKNIRDKKFLYSFANSGKRKISDYTLPFQAMQNNSQLKRLFRGIMDSHDEEWAKIGSDLSMLVKASNKKVKSEYQWLLKKIDTYYLNANQIINLNCNPIINFFIACRIYLETIRQQHPLPLRKNNQTQDMIDSIFNKLNLTPPQFLNYEEISSTKKHINTLSASSVKNIYQNPLGREIITYFMEEVQVLTPKKGQFSFQKAFYSPKLLSRLLYFFNSKRNEYFIYQFYADYVPYTSFSSLYIKNLIHTLKYSVEIKSVLDPTAGWGGTLLGSALSDIEDITDNDPNKQLIEPKIKLVNFIKEKKPSINITLDHDSIESLNLDNRLKDIVLFSPPFGAYEEYDIEDTQNIQSRLRYKDKDEWTNNFIQKLIVESAKFLKEGGIFAYQVSNLKVFNNIVDQFFKFTFASGIFDSSYFRVPYSHYSSKKNPDCNYFFIFTKKAKIYRPPIVNDFSIEDTQTFFHDFEQQKIHDENIDVNIKLSSLASFYLAKNKEPITNLELSRNGLYKSFLFFTHNRQILGKRKMHDIEQFENFRPLESR